jgi:uroporphyrinogen decarboxylase
MNNVTDQPMTCRERVLAAFRFEETDPVPYVLPIEEAVAERLDHYYGGRAWRARIQQHVGGIGVPSLGVPEDPDTPYTTDHFGTVWRSDKRPNHLEKSALPEPDLTDYVWPDIDDIWDEAMIQQQLQQAQANGQFIVGSLGFGLFERTWTIRGFENALMDVVLRPDFYEALLDGILAFQLKTVRRLLTHPIDGVMFSDDWGDQRGVIIGPERWRRFVKPRMKQLCDAVHAAGKWTLLHCCGNVFDIIPDMIDIGLDVLESLQPEAMDVYEIKRRYGEDLRLWGGLGTQHTLPFETPEEVRAEIARLRRELGRGGGYILAPAKPLMPEVPTENAVAAVEAFTA